MASLSPKRFRRSCAILEALGERWRDSTNSFQLSLGEMTLTPLDFAVLTGIHVGGDQIVIDRRVTVTAAGVRAALSWSCPTDHGETIDMGVLHSRLREMPREETDHVAARCYTRCVILMAIGDLLAANGAATVHLWWLPHLMDFTRIRGMDWGSYGMATMYRSMSLYSRMLSDSHTGFAYVWEIVRFYTACFGFREPFKVLCDGTFVHHLLVNRITPADTALSNILSATVKIFTTRCVLAELKSLGDSYVESLNAAHSLIPARCDHEKRKSAVSCITEIFGENNPEHFFVATQDADLRKKFREIPGVPLIFGLRHALLLEPPSTFQHHFVKSAEEERSHMSELEYKMLNMRKKNRLAIEEVRDYNDAAEGMGDQISGIQGVKTYSATKGRDVTHTVQFKRNKAKGPNPLSRKKKKSQKNQNLDPEKTNLHLESKDSEKTMRSRSRKRKRSRKSKNLAESTG